MTEVRVRMPSRPSIAIEVAWNVTSFALAFVTLCAVCGQLDKERCAHDRCGPSRVDIAKMMTQKLVFEAYPHWAMANPDRTCPTLEELLEYTDRKDPRDPWGRPYELECRAHEWRPNVVVASRGEDGVRGTYDDISSNL